VGIHEAGFHGIINKPLEGDTDEGLRHPALLLESEARDSYDQRSYLAAKQLTKGVTPVTMLHPVTSRINMTTSSTPAPSILTALGLTNRVAGPFVPPHAGSVDPIFPGTDRRWRRLKKPPGLSGLSILTF
jgi:hypothetical protein